MLIQNPPREGGPNYLSINGGLFCAPRGWVRVTICQTRLKKRIKQENRKILNLVILLILASLLIPYIL